MELTKQQLLNVRGGGLGVFAGIGALIVFVIGVIDGYVRPYKCR